MESLLKFWTRLFVLGMPPGKVIVGIIDVASYESFHCSPLGRPERFSRGFNSKIEDQVLASIPNILIELEINRNSG